MSPDGRNVYVASPGGALRGEGARRARARCPRGRYRVPSARRCSSSCTASASVDSSPAQVWATLLDEGTYLASERTSGRGSTERLSQLACVRMSHGVGGRTKAAAIDAELARVVAEHMQVLAAPSRVQILGRLKDGPCAVGDLADAVGMEPSAVSHQLRQLRYLGMVVGERRGKHVIYALHDPHVAELLDQAVFHVQHLRLGAGRPLTRDAKAS